MIGHLKALDKVPAHYTDAMIAAVIKNRVVNSYACKDCCSAVKKISLNSNKHNYFIHRAPAFYEGAE
jgi:uncharacterized protein YlaI